MVVPHYGYLKLKMLSPWGVIVVAPSIANVYLYEQEGTALTMADVTAANFAWIQHQPRKEPPHSTKGNLVVAFCPVNDTKMVQIHPQDPKK